MILLFWPLLSDHQWFQLHLVQWSWLAREIHIDLYVLKRSNNKTFDELNLHTIPFKAHAKILNTVIRVTEFKSICKWHISICINPIQRTARWYICDEYKKNLLKSQKKLLKVESYLTHRLLLKCFQFYILSHSAFVLPLESFDQFYTEMRNKSCKQKSISIGMSYIQMNISLPSPHNWQHVLLCIPKLWR